MDISFSGNQSFTLFSGWSIARHVPWSQESPEGSTQTPGALTPQDSVVSLQTSILHFGLLLPWTAKKQLCEGMVWQEEMLTFWTGPKSALHWPPFPVCWTALPQVSPAWSGCGSRKDLAWRDFGAYCFTALLSLIGKALDSNTTHFFLFLTPVSINPHSVFLAEIHRGKSDSIASSSELRCQQKPQECLASSRKLKQCSLYNYQRPVFSKKWHSLDSLHLHS